MVKGVQHQEELLCRQETAQPLPHRLAAFLTNAERFRNRRRHELGIGQRGERHDEDPIGKVVAQLGRRLEGQSGLADASRTREREEANLRATHEIDDLLQVLLPTQEGGRRQRHGIQRDANDVRWRVHLRQGLGATAGRRAPV